MDRKTRTISFLALRAVLGFLISLTLGAVSASKTDCSIRSSFYPKASFMLERSGYSLSYDGRTKGATWVYECLTPELIKLESIERKNFEFTEDRDIPLFLRSTNRDFHKSGYDRGHLCPAMNAKCSKEAMRDSFLLTNASPQVPELNRGIWKELESKIRKLAIDGKTVHVYTLPLFIPLELEGKRFIHYEVIGEKDIAVPTHFAKVAMIEGGDSMAYILPNHKTSSGKNLEDFKTTIEKVEKTAGILFPAFDKRRL